MRKNNSPLEIKLADIDVALANLVLYIKKQKLSKEDIDMILNYLNDDVSTIKNIVDYIKNIKGGAL